MVSIWIWSEEEARPILISLFRQESIKSVIPERGSRGVFFISSR